MFRARNNDHKASPGSVRRANRSGFTLVEMIATTSLMAILAASAIPAMGRITALQQSAVVGRLAEDLRTVRVRSVATGLPTFIRFNSAGSATAWSLMRLPTASSLYSAAVTVTDLSTGAPAAGPDAGTTAVTLTVQQGTAIGFDSRGRPIATDGTVLSSDATVQIGSAALIRVTAFTGAITVARQN